MDRFLSGFMGVGLGFVLFLPSYLFTRQAVKGGPLSSAPLLYRVPMFLGMFVMMMAPVVFWGLAPFRDKLKEKMD